MGSGNWQRGRILAFVQEFARHEGYKPSYREIAEGLGLALGTVSHHLSVLQRDGTLRHGPGRPRTITEPGETARRAWGDKVEVPFISHVRAGELRDAVDLAEDTTYPLPQWLVGHGTIFMLEVKGDSMTGAAIIEGDLLLVRQQPTAENGEIVVAQVRDGETAEATVKTLQRLGGHTWLLPHNPAYQPILADDAEILGKVVALIRPPWPRGGALASRLRWLSPSSEGRPQIGPG